MTNVSLSLVIHKALKADITEFRSLTLTNNATSKQYAKTVLEFEPSAHVLSITLPFALNNDQLQVLALPSKAKPFEQVTHSHQSTLCSFNIHEVDPQEVETHNKLAAILITNLNVDRVLQVTVAMTTQTTCRTSPGAQIVTSTKCLTTLELDTSQPVTSVVLPFALTSEQLQSLTREEPETCTSSHVESLKQHGADMRPLEMNLRKQLEPLSPSPSPSPQNKFKGFIVRKTP